MIKSLFLLIKNQWKFVKKYGIVKEIVRIWEKAFRPIKDFVFGKDWFKEGAKEDLKIIKKIFKEKEIQFFLIFGTCLGAVREGDFIEWDHDIDLGIIEKTPPEMREEICEALRKEGFKIEYQSYQRCSEIICKRKVEASIVWFQKEKENFIWRDKKRKGEIEVQVPAKLFEKFREANLGGEKFLVPNPPEIYLEKTYQNWKTPQKRAFTKLLIEK